MAEALGVPPWMPAARHIRLERGGTARARGGGFPDRPRPIPQCGGRRAEVARQQTVVHWPGHCFCSLRVRGLLSTGTLVVPKAEPPRPGSRLRADGGNVSAAGALRVDRTRHDAALRAGPDVAAVRGLRRPDVRVDDRRAVGAAARTPARECGARAGPGASATARAPASRRATFKACEGRLTRPSAAAGNSTQSVTERDAGVAATATLVRRAAIGRPCGRVSTPTGCGISPGRKGNSRVRRALAVRETAIRRHRRTASSWRGPCFEDRHRGNGPD